MANNKISILVTAQDQASPALRKVQGSLDETGARVEQQSTLMKRLSDNWSTFAGISVAAGFALRGVYGQMSESVKAANDLQASLLGLNSIARHFGQDANAAKRAAQDLANDGLMTVADSATGLKNLLAAGFNLPQAITLMERFKDSAAFNRQAALGFGQAIRGATEGIKNGNSILVDNAGVTKNLSIILKEAGFAETDLMRASSDAGVRMALFNGILKETNPMVGDAAKLSGIAAGKQAEMSAETIKLHQQIGLALQPALLAFLRTVTPIIQNLSQWVQEHQYLSAAIMIGTGILLAMVASLGVLATAVRSTQVVIAVFGPAAASSFGLARGALTSFRALAMSPLVMPALAIGAALASIASVVAAIKAARDMYKAWDATTNQISEEMRVADQVRDRLKYLQQHGDAGQRARATAALKAGLTSGNDVGRRALGTNFAPGGSTWVGEHGPELVSLPQGSRVAPAWQSRGQGAGQSIMNIYITGPVSMNSQQDIESLASRIDKTQRLAAVGMA